MTCATPLRIHQKHMAFPPLFASHYLHSPLAPNMIAIHPPPAVTDQGLNPAADEYLPVHPHQMAAAPELLPPPPPPLKFVPRPFHHHPPPPPPQIVLARPVPIVWAPVNYAYVTPTPGYPAVVLDSSKVTMAPELKGVHRNFDNPSGTCVSKAKEYRPIAGPAPTDRRPDLPPRLLARPSTTTRRFWRRRTNSDTLDSPTPVGSELVAYPFGDCTTLMIRNIPIRLRRTELVNLLADHCVEMNKKGAVTSEFDLVYLPMDFRRLGNKGYAFVNFTTADGAAGLYRAWNNLTWDKFGYESKKTRLITTAKIQGKERLKTHLLMSLWECDTDDYLAVELTPPCNGSNLAAVTSAPIGIREKPIGRRRSVVGKGRHRVN